jgi:Spy/CpxP family protein refolding chaperone
MKTRIVGSLLVAAVVAVPVNGFAQMKGMSGGDHGGAHEAPMGGDMMDLKRFTHALSSLNLTAEQTQSLKRLRIQHQKDAIPLLAKVHMANVELDELELAEKPDLKKAESIVKRKHEALATLEVSHIDLIHNMKAVLTPIQRQELEAILEHGHKDHGKETKDGHEQPGQSGGHSGH